jgi:hypothetical protein
MVDTSWLTHADARENAVLPRRALFGQDIGADGKF